MKKKYHKTITIFLILIAILFLALIIYSQANPQTATASASTISNKKVGWGIKREDNHQQPDLGTYNKKIMDQYDGICMGNAEDKYVYLTFDEGYEAGYTEKILAVLKENEVPAAFFITAHYLNTQPDLVKQMIDDGHIVGNHTPNYLMSGNNIEVKC